MVRTGKKRNKFKNGPARVFRLRYSPRAAPSYSPPRKAEPPDKRVVPDPARPQQPDYHCGSGRFCSWACNDAEPDIVVLIRRIVVVAIRRTQVVLVVVVTAAADHATAPASFLSRSPSRRAEYCPAKSIALGMLHMPGPRNHTCANR